MYMSMPKKIQKIKKIVSLKNAKLNKYFFAV